MNGDCRAMFFVPFFRQSLVSERRRANYDHSEYDFCSFAQLSGRTSGSDQDNLSPKTLKNQVTNYHPSDLADSFPELTKEGREKWIVLSV